MKLRKGHPKFNEAFARYMGSKQGQAMALYILSQLVDVIEIDGKGHVTHAELSADKPIVLDIE